MLRGGQFGDDAVFARAEEGTLGAHQKQHGITKDRVGHPECQAAQPHQHDFGKFDQHDNTAFAEAVGQDAGKRGKQQKRNHKQHRGGRADLRGLVLSEFAD